MTSPVAHPLVRTPPSARRVAPRSWLRSSPRPRCSARWCSRSRPAPRARRRRARDGARGRCGRPPARRALARAGAGRAGRRRCACRARRPRRRWTCGYFGGGGLSPRRRGRAGGARGGAVAWPRGIRGRGSSGASRSRAATARRANPATSGIARGRRPPPGIASARRCPRSARPFARAGPSASPAPRRTACSAAAAASSSGSSTSRARPRSCASRRPGRPTSSSARRRRPAPTADEAIARMRFALGVDDDLREFHDRFRSDPLIGPSVRAAAVAADHPPARPVRGARRGRSPSSSSSSRAPSRSSAGSSSASAAPARRPACATCPTPARVAGTAPALLQSFDLSAGRGARAAPRGARGRGRPRRPPRRRPRARLAAPARDPRHRALDDRDARPPRPGPPRPVPAGDLSLIKLVGRLQDRQPARARHRGGGARVLRALRRAGPGSPAAHALRAATRDRRSRDYDALAGQELVRQRRCRRRAGCLQQPVARHPVAVGRPLGRVLPAERLRRVGREEDRQRRRTLASCRRAVEVAVGAQQRRRSAVRVVAQRVRALRRARCMKRRTFAPPSRRSVVAGARRSRARRRSARRRSPCG